MPRFTPKREPRGKPIDRQIVGLYDALLRLESSPVIQLNRAVAVAMRDGPEAGLVRIEPLLSHETLGRYRLTHAAKADLLRRLGRFSEAKTSYEAALALTRQEPEQRFLKRRLAEISGWPAKNFRPLSIPGQAVRPMEEDARRKRREGVVTERLSLASI